MKIRYLAAIALLLPTATFAKGYLAKECNVTMPCATSDDTRGSRSRYKNTRRARGSVSLSGVVAPLANKIRSIQEACPGTVILSTIRHTRRPDGKMSLHHSGRAVDVRGNYACIYRELQGWPSYSTDARRCRHVHISYGGDEGHFRHRYC